MTRLKVIVHCLDTLLGDFVLLRILRRGDNSFKRHQVWSKIRAFFVSGWDASAKEHYRGERISLLCKKNPPMTQSSPKVIRFNFVIWNLYLHYWREERIGQETAIRYWSIANRVCRNARSSDLWIVVFCYREFTVKNQPRHRLSWHAFCCYPQSLQAKSTNASLHIPIPNYSTGILKCTSPFQLNDQHYFLHN